MKKMQIYRNCMYKCQWIYLAVSYVLTPSVGQSEGIMKLKKLVWNLQFFQN